MRIHVPQVTFTLIINKRVDVDLNVGDCDDILTYFTSE